MSLFGMFKRTDQKPVGSSKGEVPLVNEDRLDRDVEEKPTLAKEAEDRGMVNVHSWEDIHVFDIKYFEKEIRDIFKLGGGEDVFQAIIKKAREGFSFGLGIIAKYYGLPPDATFLQVKAKKEEKEGKKGE